MMDYDYTSCAFDDITTDETTSKLADRRHTTLILVWHIVDGGGLEWVLLRHS